MRTVRCATNHPDGWSRGKEEGNAGHGVEEAERRAKETAGVATANRNYRPRLMIASFIIAIYSRVLKSKA